MERQGLGSSAGIAQRLLGKSASSGGMPSASPSSGTGAETAGKASPSVEAPAAAETSTTSSARPSSAGVARTGGGSTAMSSAEVASLVAALPGDTASEKFKALSPTSFNRVFGMDKAAFDALPEWRRKDMRKAAHLF